jgi:integrase
MKCAIKKFYKVENGGHKEPEKTKFFAVGSPETTVTREDLFTDDELQRLFRSFGNLRDRALTMVFYESAARPGEILSRTIADFTANADGDFIHLTGLKDTPDRTNQLVRSGRVLREWLAQHPLGGELGAIQDPSAPLWVKTEQHRCRRCGDIPHRHEDEQCDYAPDRHDPLTHAAYYRRFQKACERAEIPENKRRPYNLRHTRLTEVATFMGYEQLNKFAGWKPGSDRAKVYVHLNNDDVNRAIREEYGLSNGDDEQKSIDCPFCGAENQREHSECRQCGRPMSLEQQAEQKDALNVLERLRELEKKGVLEKIEQIDGSEASA